MKYTLLELTQDVLSSMDSDEINSISDTVESQQVVKILKSVYDDIVSRGDLNNHKIMFNLTPSGDGTKPVLMFKPSSLDRIEWVKYNCIRDGDTDPIWREMRFLEPHDFINWIYQYVPSESNVDTFDYTSDDGFTYTFYYRNDTAPSYFTTLDDTAIIFDAFDSEVDSTLQSSKTLCFGSKKTEWVEEDTWTPVLEPQQFQLLLNEAKSVAWAELKQMAHQKAELSARRNWRHLQKTRQTVVDPKPGAKTHPFYSQLPNFGRK